MDKTTSTRGRQATAASHPATARAVDAAADQIGPMLEQYRVFRDVRLNRLFNILPPVILVVTTIYLFGFWTSRQALQIDFAAAGLTTVFSMVVMRVLFARFPQVLLIIWRRDLLKTKNGPTPAASLVSQFQEFISRSEDLVNSRSSLIFGVAVTVIVLWIFWPFRVTSVQGWVNRFHEAFGEATLAILLRLIYYVAAFIAGLFLWRVVIIARTIHKLGSEFEFNLQTEHPDGCGGFRPIGDLCLDLAYILAPLLLAIGGLLVLFTLVRPEILQTVFNTPTTTLPTVSMTLQLLGALIIVLSLFGFFQPLVSVHNAMGRARDRLQDELDRISQEIHDASTELRNNAESLTTEQGAALEQKIDFLRRVYNRNMKIPTWPINYDHLWRLLTIQIAPTIGIVTSGIGLVNSVVGMFR